MTSSPGTSDCSSQGKSISFISKVLLRDHGLISWEPLAFKHTTSPGCWASFSELAMSVWSRIRALFSPDSAASPAHKSHEDADEALWQQVYAAREDYYLKHFGQFPNNILKIGHVFGVWPGGGLFVIPATVIGADIVAHTTFGFSNPDMPATTSVSDVDVERDEHGRVTKTSGRLQPKTKASVADGKAGYGGCMATGYSGTPLVKKLGIKEGSKVLIVGAPDEYLDLLEPLPNDVQFVATLSKSIDLVHVFTDRKAELQKLLSAYRKKLDPTAAVWVSWPKKSAKVPTDITEDTVREVALPLGFVDVKVCAVTELWSGLKLVVRKEPR